MSFTISGNMASKGRRYEVTDDGGKVVNVSSSIQDAEAYVAEHSVVAEVAEPSPPVVSQPTVDEPSAKKKTDDKPASTKKKAAKKVKK